MKPPPRLALSLCAVVILKVILILLAKKIWFSQPLATHMQVPAARVEQHMLHPAATPPPESQTPRSPA